ncbi:hypothetical protein [Novosphingobium terrae]|uniref:hypothetical protein n=1 Tax=Novosphingobium terrae TaxID=2726189 RepID=UPI001980A515|nr:hypothetical protein [Novosphingobium terrae]
MTKGRRSICILATALCVSCQSDPKSFHVPSQSCEVALSYVKEFGAKAESPVAVFFAPTSEDLGTANKVSIDQFLRENPEWKKRQDAQLDIELIKKSEKFSKISVIQQCSVLHEWWKEHSAIHDDEEIRRIVGSIPPRNSEEWKPLSKGILAISVPVISDDGTIARLNVAEITNFEGGRFEVTYSRGLDGKWHMKDKSGRID